MNAGLRKVAPLVLVLVLAGLGYLAWAGRRDANAVPGLVSGNGRVEATEVDVATKLPGRVENIFAAEGDFVHAGQPLAQMQVESLQAQHDEALARQQQALHAVAGAEAQVALRQADQQAAQALVLQRESELDAAQRRLARSETLAGEGASSGQELDDDRARVRSTQAALVATRAQVKAAEAAVVAAAAQVTGAKSAVTASEASVARVDVDLRDSVLKAPRDGRVQYRVAQAGEVLGGGAKVLNLVDLSDVSMTFFLPEAMAGKVALGSEVRIILDAAPQYVIPAKISYVASTAQFTPKTVETASERQKLMFRVKAQIDRDLLQKHLQQVKTGLPGVAWVKLDAQATWPDRLSVKVAP
ncbi:HlyD family secretion protein [Roseateles koreensis]|uniref:HlyD family efflux transporter periplasmic adaptor subunit n=1 Tax=Roseateles koreensis TaxID=2987526 RepID=A0ABT5KPA2_9BURK|nr:HlyD family efflux transporter periplasmic adaptor subunit [Roseateles koreensis]MDC8784265.1 HlyD family efflux transporter periplasmic adaptor subunit [Roseateles koreensis]